jgi:chromosome segregation ATPase
MKLTAIAFYLTVIIISSTCTDFPTRDDSVVSDLKSEVIVLKKRLALVEKTNDLFEAENADVKKRLNSLKDDYQLLKSKSEERIKTLTDLSEKQKAEFIETTSRMAADIKKKEKDLTGKLELAKQEAAHRENDLSKTIDGLKKIISDKEQQLMQKETEIQSLKAGTDILKTELADGVAKLSQCDNKTAELLKELETLKSAIEKKDKLLKEREKHIEKPGK